MSFPHHSIIPPSPQGWECPKCGRVYSPSTSMCFTCPTPPLVSPNTVPISPAPCEHDWGDLLTGGRQCKKCLVWESPVTWGTVTIRYGDNT